MSTLQDLIPVCYVRDLDAAQAFYQLLGLTELRRGDNDRGGYRYLAEGECTLLVAQVDPCPVTAALPLGLYVWSADVAAVEAVLIAAGVPCQHVGHPDHAPGGELRTADPDGNVVVIGQRTATSTSHGARLRAGAGFSILKEAAARAAASGDAPESCEIGERGGVTCAHPAEVKLADPWGATVWGCLPHAEEALLNARAAFVASDDGDGLTPWLRQRRQPRR